MIECDHAWLRANPLPDPDEARDKNERGRLLVIGGGTTVPGGIRLTAEAALRVGAGKVKIATVASCATALGVPFPEVGILALPQSDTGEIGNLAPLEGQAEKFDAVVAGPAIISPLAGNAVLDWLERECSSVPVVFDAGALMAEPHRISALAANGASLILTPHHGELARLMECDMDELAADPPAAAVKAARRFGAVVALKGRETFIADPAGQLVAFRGGSIGLATGGSGDVLAGVAGGLAARGAAPFATMVWAAWLHGTAGARCARRIGSIGFLARDLLPDLPVALHL